MAMSASFRSSILRRKGFRRQCLALPFSSAAGANGGESGRQPAGGHGGAVAGFLAVGGSGIAMWLLPWSPDSSLSFADSASGRTDLRSPIRFLDASSAQEKKPRFLLGDSYRKRVFFNYEKRLRLRSTPEKIFEYFASVRSPEGEIFMTPADLMRAVVPVFPPSDSDIVREGHLPGERQPGMLHCATSSLFMLFDTNNDGLISFPEYIFLVTLLSIPESSFSVTFRMFDLDNNGEIEIEEFKKVMALMRSYNGQGACHRDGLRIGLKVRRSVENGGLVEYFFGNDRQERLQLDKFIQFLRDLHHEIVRLEFDHYDFNSRKTISAKDFALSMVASADIKHINKFLDRVDDLSNNSHLRDIQITFEEFKDFAELRKRLQPLTVAIFSYGKLNGLLTKQDFKRAASQVCGVSLTDNVVDILFYVFDSNSDGNLSTEEFLRAMQRRETDIRQPTVTGVMGLMSCWLNCSSCSSRQMVQ